MKRSVRGVAAVVAVQAALVGVYWLVEHRRSQDSGSRPLLSTAPPLPLAGQMEPLSVRTRDGGALDLAALDRPHLVHLWATWCPPCRAELPGLLGIPDAYRLDVVAVALDERWADVDRFFGGQAPRRVVLGHAKRLEGTLGVRELPVTFLVEPGGRLRLRFDGARDWTDRTFLNTWITDTGSD